MAAFLKFAPGHGAMTAAETITRLNHEAAATLRHQAQRRPTLVCRWQRMANGRLCCYWEIGVPTDIPIPPH
jgi:hypothetical protein